MKKWMNEWMNARMNERMNEWMNEWMNERTNERKNERTNERTNEWMNEWTNDWMNGWMIEWMIGRMNEIRIEEWMNERTNEWRNEENTEEINEYERITNMYCIRLNTCVIIFNTIVFNKSQRFSKKEPAFGMYFPCGKTMSVVKKRTCLGNIYRLFTLATTGGSM